MIVNVIKCYLRGVKIYRYFYFIIVKFIYYILEIFDINLFVVGGVK